MDQFPSNRKTVDPPAVAPQREEKHVQQIVQGGVVRRKTPWSRRVTQKILGGDSSQSVSEAVFGDVLLPAFRDMIADAGVSYVERRIYGENASPRGRRVRGSSAHTPYHQMSSRTARPRDEPRRELSRRARATHDFQEIILEGRAEGDEVLDRLADLIRKFESASVADLYGMLGIPAHYTDDKYGWYDLGNARPVRVRGGYLLDLPRPEVLD